jgi:hypothetical protein
LERSPPAWARRGTFIIEGTASARLPAGEARDEAGEAPFGEPAFATALSIIVFVDCVLCVWRVRACGTIDEVVAHPETTQLLT